MSNAEAVREFTEDSGTVCPLRPKPMDRAQVTFIIRMIMSELDELACTVTGSPEERDALLRQALDTRDVHKWKPAPEAVEELVGEQFDALVDSWYYSLNVAAKHGVNMSSMFDLVHSANMAKRDPASGKFLRRCDGKIIKPEGWKEPDITGEIRRQLDQGAWKH